MSTFRFQRFLASLLLGWLALEPRLGLALIVEEKIALSGIPVAQWIVLISGTHSQMLPASVRSSDGAVVFSAEVGELSPGTLVSAVVQLADGSMTSSPLHSPESAAISGESRALAERRRSELLKRQGELRSDIARLERDMESAQSALRVNAGLADVDKVYQKRAAILKEIATLRGEGEG